MKSEPNAREVICPTCLTANGAFTSFCHRCGAPIGATSTLDPIQSINTQSFLFRKALDGRPKPIVLAGIWVIFFPVLLGCVYGSTHLILNRTGFSDFFAFWAFVGLAYVSFTILYRITKNYLTNRRKIDSIHSSSGAA